MKMAYELRAVVDFLDVFKASALSKRDDDTWTAAMKRVRKLKYVSEACIDHMCIIEISTETANAQIADRRIKSVITKASRIIKSYRSKP